MKILEDSVIDSFESICSCRPPVGNMLFIAYEYMYICFIYFVQRILFIAYEYIYTINILYMSSIGAHITIICPQLGTHDCRQTPVSRSAARLSVVGFPVWCSRSVAIQTVTNHTNCMVRRGQKILIDSKKI